MSKARDLASASPAPSTVSATELGYLDGVTSAVQTQINSKIGQSTAINPSIVDAKGDIIAATAADTVARLAVGANNTILTADSSTSTGLKWSAPAASGMVELATGSLSGTTVTISSISGAYKKLYLVIFNARSNNNMGLRFNGDTGNNYNINFYDHNGTVTNMADRDLLIWDGTGSNNTTRLMTFEIPFYTNTTTWKYVGMYGGRNNAQPANLTGSWTSTSAITSISMFSGGGANFDAGTYTLYGVN